MLSGSGIQRLWIGSEEYVAMARPFDPSNGANQPAAIIMRSLMNEVLDPALVRQDSPKF